MKAWLLHWLALLLQPGMLALIAIMIGFWFLGSYLKRVEKKLRDKERD